MEANSSLMAKKIEDEKLANFLEKSIRIGEKKFESKKNIETKKESEILFDYLVKGVRIGDKKYNLQKLENENLEKLRKEEEKKLENLEKDQDDYLKSGDGQDVNQMLSNLVKGDKTERVESKRKEEIGG